MPVRAERSSFRTYDADQGLSSVGGFCMLQDHAGYMLVCTEHGLFAYDGRRFVNLGPEQGLRQGGIIYGLALTSTGRVAIEYAGEVLVSNRPSDASHPPSTLMFHAALHPGISFSSDRPHRIAPWQGGLVFIAGETLVKIVVPERDAPHVETLGYDSGEQALLTGGLSVFSTGEQIWTAFANGRLCMANPGAVKCYSAAEGLRGGPWMDVIAGAGGTVLARSATSVATLDPATGRWDVVALPDQGDRYLNYLTHLGLFRTPDGGLVTQADHGLAILQDNHWRVMTVDDGAPSGTIVSAITDATGQFWLQVYGSGLIRWTGYGHWETVEKADGLSDGVPWMTVRVPGGAMWVATDTGIDEIVRRGAALKVGKIFPGTSFALAVGPHGALWSSFGLKGVKIIDPSSGVVTTLAVPPVNAIRSGCDGTIWIATELGLFRVDERPGVPLQAVLQNSPQTPVPDVICDGTGGAFYLTGGRLRHRHRDGTDVSVGGDWPAGDSEPLALAFGHDGTLWIGGPGGLFRFIVSNDIFTSYEPVSIADTQSNTILAIMVDHRGWVWIGTTLGISVFDGKRWVSEDANGGLLSNDVDQGGIREDPDGSIWVATSHGLSHLLDPASLFADHPIKAVISGALLGSLPVTGRTMPYTVAALDLHFGTPNYGAERSILFRYWLSGVDAEWAESPAGMVHYPFVPPGRHVLTVVSYDQLTHRTSEPAILVVDIAYPWWRRWWSEGLWLLCAIGFVYGVTRFRVRAILARQTELSLHVAEATEQLRYQATHDSLTGLLNRSEIERRLAEKLSGGPAGAEMIVALIDIDHFKHVNDKYGHLGGDDVLRSLGRLIRGTVRDGEHAGRYGGEEILLVVHDFDGGGAKRVLDLHRAVRHDTFRAAGSAVHVTCSIGLAWAVSGDDWESLIGRADDALYQAKKDGRDCVVESSIDPNRRNMAANGSGPDLVT